MRLRINLHVIVVDAKMIVGDAGLTNGVFGDNAAGAPANEFADPREGVGPKRVIQRRVVDVPDETRQPLVVAHVPHRKSEFGVVAVRRCQTASSENVRRHLTADAA